MTKNNISNKVHFWKTRRIKMNIKGISGANTGMGHGVNMGNNIQNDSVSKHIQNQIINAQKKLQDLSDDKEMSLEDKMKKRQEILQEIANLNQQLRQHQMELRKENQQKEMSMNDMLGGNSKSNASKGDKQGMKAMSQATMTAIISADSSMKQAQVQGATADSIEGRARVLESEIKMDKSRGDDTGKKQEELNEMKVKEQEATSAQLSTLADANKTMKEAAETDREAEAADKKTDRAEERKDKNIEDKVDGATIDVNMAEDVSVDIRL